MGIRVTIIIIDVMLTAKIVWGRTLRDLRKFLLTSGFRFVEAHAISMCAIVFRIHSNYRFTKGSSQTGLAVLKYENVTSVLTSSERLTNCPRNS